MRSGGIIMRILQIIVILKGLRVGLLCYMWVILMWECPLIRKRLVLMVRNQRSTYIFLAWVMQSSDIIMRILQIIVILKGLRVGLLCYMWVILMWECPLIRKRLVLMVRNQRSTYIFLAWVMRSSGIIMRILQIIVMLKCFRVSLLCYMWVTLSWECPLIKKETCSGG